MFFNHYIVKKIQNSNVIAGQYIFELNQQLNNTPLSAKWRINNLISKINENIDTRNKMLNRIFSLDYINFELRFGMLCKLNLLDSTDRKSRKMFQA